ncbi:hypothetical protein BDW67DRAFT_84403 [Aspergillus spinulosporus]
MGQETPHTENLRSPHIGWMVCQIFFFLPVMYSFPWMRTLWDCLFSKQADERVGRMHITHIRIGATDCTKEANGCLVVS